LLVCALNFAGGVVAPTAHAGMIAVARNGYQEVQTMVRTSLIMLLLVTWVGVPAARSEVTIETVSVGNPGNA